MINTMPNMANTLNGWETSITLVKITQNIVDGDLVTSEQKISFMGVWQALKDEILELKPEGQRSWSWYWIHAKSGTLNLNTADKIIYQGKRYKVMQRKDYSLNGYVEYQVVEDYESISNG
jgi:hypothetical protein